MLDFPDDGQIRFRKIRDAGSVLNATLVFIRRNARELVPSYLALVAPLAVIAAISSTLLLSNVSQIYTNPEAILNDPFSVFGPGYFIGILLALMAGTMAQAAAGGYVRLYRQGRAGEITPGVLWEETRGLLLPVLGWSVMVGVAFLATGILNLIPCLGSIAWAVLVFWAAPVVAVGLVSRILETDSISEAWARARMLVKGSWGFVFGALFLAGLIMLLFAFAVGMVTGVLGIVIGIGTGFDLSEGPRQITVAMAVVQAISGVLSYIVYLIPFVAAYFIHGRLAEELDGTTLHDDLDVLAEAGFDMPAPSSPPQSTPPRLDPPSDRPAPPQDPSDSGGFRGGGFGT